ncbi:MAG: glycosyltransferase family 2 protein [Planctomycetia bacterium]
MTQAVPSASVIIATAGTSPRLHEVLAAVRTQADALGAEVVLARNHAQAAPAGAAHDAGHAASHDALADQVLFEPTVGKSHALNRAVRAARGPVCAFLDDDGLPSSGWLAALLLPFAVRDATLAGVGGRVLPSYSMSRPPWYMRALGDRRTHFLGPLHDLGELRLPYDASLPGDLPLGANCAYRRDLLLDVPYAADLGPNRLTGCRGGEDTLLARQLLARGYRLEYVGAALVTHPVDPRRMTPQYVAEGYYWQGVESVRMRRALGKDVGRSRLLRMLGRYARYRLYTPLYGVVSEAKRVRWVSRAAFARGAVDEMLHRKPMPPALAMHT